MNSTDRARLIVLVGVAFASLSAIFIRLSDSPPLVIAFYRMLFTSAMLLPPYLLRLHRRRSDIGPQRHPVRVIALLLLSGVFLALHFATWITSLRYTSVASAVVLVTLHPVFVATGSIVFLRESVRPAVFLCIFSAIAGSIILSLSNAGSETGALTGNLLAVAGAVAVSGYMLIGRAVRRTVGVVTYNFSVYLTATVVLMVFVVLSGEPFSGYSLREFALFLALAFFCTILGHSIFNWGLKYLPASFVSASILLEPISASVLAAVLFAEIPGPMALLGGFIVVASLFGVIRLDAQAKSST
ncbi:MAG: DMT family transporter, partial [bacterium]